MNKTLHHTSTLVFIFFFSFQLHAQFTGGAGSGFAYNISAPLQISDTLFNDLSVESILSPANNDTLSVFSSFPLSFILENTGTYPVLPAHGIFADILINNIIVYQETLYVTDTLNPGQTTNMAFTSPLSIADTGLSEICIELNGTIFSPDTITINNKSCILVHFMDFTNIENHSNLNLPEVLFYRNSNTLHINAVNPISGIVIFDATGKTIKEEWYKTQTFSTEKYIRLYNLKSGLYILCVYSNNYLHTVKFIK